MLKILDLKTPPTDFLLKSNEGYAFHSACLNAKLDQFKIGYLIVLRQNIRITTIPYFEMDFPLNTMLPAGLMKRALSWLKLHMVCIGHPLSDIGQIDGEVSEEILSVANDFLSRKSKLITYKGFINPLPLPNFVKARSLPIAELAVTQDFYKRLSREKRKNLRQRKKKESALKFMESDGIPESLLDSIYGLYWNTCKKAETDFEFLTKEYFAETSSISKYILVFEDNELIGFAQLIGNKDRMESKYLGMDYDRGLKYGLYFLMVLRAVDICIREGTAILCLGVTSYSFKAYLGSNLKEIHNYYWHANPAVNWILKRLKWLFEPTKEELGAEAPKRLENAG